jgi:uncharacterized phage protein gp47/JayE
LSIPGYVSFPFGKSSDDILATAYAYIKSRAPAWRENDANLDTWILQALASESADMRQVATNVSDLIFRYFGAGMLNIPMTDAAAASGSVTITAKDVAGYTISAGTQVGIRDATGTLIPFQTTNDLVIVPGDIDGVVNIVAVIPGSSGTNLGVGGTNVELIDPLAFVTNVTLVATTSGGVDAETPTQYDNRLVRRLRRLSMRPILPEDFANMALDVAGVYRAVAVDGYNTVGGTFGNTKMVTVAAVDANGNAVSAATKTAIQTYLNANREVNFVVNVMDPNIQAIDVTATVKCVPGADPVAVKAAVEAALRDYLSAAKWGLDPRISGSAALQTWVDSPTVRYMELVHIVSDVTGVDYIMPAGLTLAKAGQAQASADVGSALPALLYTSGTIVCNAL